jgi:hypothetical protein
VKRTVLLVSEEPTRRNGKARLYAYGIRAIAEVIGTSAKTVRRASGRDFDPASLASVLRFVNERQSHERHQATAKEGPAREQGRP